MPFPILILGGLAAAALLAAASSSKTSAAHDPNPPPPQDPGIPAADQKAIDMALAYESDPAKLRAFANAIRATYPLGAAALDAKAASLEAVNAASSGGGPAPLSNVPAVAIDDGAPPEVLAELAKLVDEGDPVTLIAYSNELGKAGYHRASSWLVDRATDDPPRYPVPAPPGLPPYLPEAQAAAHPADALDATLDDTQAAAALALLANELDVTRLGQLHIHYGESGAPKTAQLFAEKMHEQIAFRNEYGLPVPKAIDDSGGAVGAGASDAIGAVVQRYDHHGVPMALPPSPFGPRKIAGSAGGKLPDLGPRRVGTSRGGLLPNLGGLGKPKKIGHF